MADIQDTDLFLVNRSDTTSTVAASELMAEILDDDLMLVNRSDVTYTVTGADVKASLGGGTTIDPTPGEITANPDFQGGTGTELDPYILTPIEVRGAGGNGLTVEQITIQLTNPNGVELVDWDDKSVGAGDRFAQPTGATDENGKWVGRLIYRDIPDSADDIIYTGDIQIGTTYFRWVVTQVVNVSIAPVIDSVSLVESNAGENPRFTDQEFVATVTLSEEGDPVSTKTIDAYVEGAITTEVQFTEPLESSSGNDLIFAAGTDMSSLAGGDTVEQGATNGTVATVDNTSKTVTLSSSSGTWIDGVDVVGPEKRISVDNVKKYLKFDNTGAVTDLLDSPQSPQYAVTDANPTLTLTFPSTFPSGEEPDTELGAGTTLTVCATALNIAGSSGPLCDTVQPEGPEFEDGWFGPASVDVVPTKDFRGGCAFGDGVYIAVGYNQIYRSIDGENWTKITTAIAINNQWTRVGYGGGRFVVVATSSSTQRAAYSTDGGLTWTAGNLAAQAWIDVAYGNGRWIAIAGSGTTKYQRYSDDGGATWTAQTPPAFANFAKRIIHDGTNFVALSSPTNGQIAYSTNGDSWTIRSMGGNDCQDIAYGDGTYLVTQGSSSGTTLGFTRSTDLENWETVTTPNMLANPLQITYGNGNFVMCGNDVGFKFLVSSDNGDTWIGANGVDQTKIFRYIDFAGDRFIAVSGNMGGTGNRYLDYSFYGFDATIRSMTEEELTAQKLRFGTYENRAAVYQGEQAMQERARVAQELEEEYGVTSEMIDEIIPPQNKPAPSKRTRKKKTD